MTFDDGFNTRWMNHPEFQAQIENQFFPKTNWSLEEFRGMTVLDAGCGCGRFSALVAPYAEKVIAVDIAPAALEATRKNCEKFGNVEVLKCNLLEPLPIGPCSVDMAFSLGVLHHTGNTKTAFMNVAETVRVDGEFSVWLYPQPAPLPLMPLVEMLHEITRAVPAETLHSICERWSCKVRDLYAFNEYGTVQWVMKVSDARDDDECISDTFDWHTPKYRDWHTTNEVRDWFIISGFDVLRVNDIPTSLTGKKIAAQRPDL